MTYSAAVSETSRHYELGKATHDYVGLVGKVVLAVDGRPDMGHPKWIAATIWQAIMCCSRVVTCMCCWRISGKAARGCAQARLCVSGSRLAKLAIPASATKHTCTSTYSAPAPLTRR